MKGFDVDTYLKAGAREERYRKIARTAAPSRPDPRLVAEATRLAGEAFRTTLKTRLDQIHRDAIDREDHALAELVQEDDSPESIARIAAARPDIMEPIVREVVESLPESVRSAIRGENDYQSTGRTIAQFISDGLGGVDPQGRIVSRAGGAIAEKVSKHGMNAPAVLSALAEADGGAEAILDAHERGEISDEEMMAAGALQFSADELEDFEVEPSLDPAALSKATDADLRKAIDGTDPFWEEFEKKETAATSVATQAEKIRREAEVTDALTRAIDGA
jgi:hypothetical protein